MNIPHDKIPLVLKRDFWPETDKSAWEEMFQAGDDWGEGMGAAASWSAGTASLREQGYGQWLSHLARTCRHLLTLPPQDRVTRVTIHAFFEECSDRGMKDRSIATLLSAIAEVMIAMAPERDWSWIRRASNSFLRTSRHQELKQLPQVTAGQVFTTALKRLHDVRRLQESAESPAQVAVAVEFRQALMVAVLMSCPVRSRAFLAMTVDVHVAQDDDDFYLNFRSEDMKDKQSRRLLLHGALKEFLAEYIQIHRRVLLGNVASNRLWITARHRPYEADSFSKFLAIYTGRMFGEQFRAHKFRHIAASSIAEEMPEHYGIIKDVLGHSTLATSEKHYNRSEGNRAKRELKVQLARFKQPTRRAK
jgi:integrase